MPLAMLSVADFQLAYYKEEAWAFLDIVLARIWLFLFDLADQSELEGIEVEY